MCASLQHTDTNGNQYLNRNTDEYTDEYTATNDNSNANRNTDGDPNEYRNCNTDQHAHEHADTNGNADQYARASRRAYLLTSATVLWPAGSR